MLHFFPTKRLNVSYGLLAVLLLALAIRLALWAQPLHQPANDEREYIAVAYDLLAGRGWIFYESYHWLRAPLYPLVLAGSLWLVGGDLHLAALPNVLLSVANVALVYLLARQLASRLLTTERPYATVAGLLAAVLLTLGTFASLYMAETLFSFLLTAALVCLLHWQQRIRIGWLLLAGLLYGLAVLTRSLPLAFLPVVLAWLVLAPRPAKASSLLARLLPAVLFGLCVALTVAPWTLRNCQAYGQCILVETGFSYNMWAFNEPRASMGEIFRTLEQIPNPAARADEATRRGMERLEEDPAILLRKLHPNWVYLWRIKPIQDRFLMATYYADPPPLLFIAALFFDDLLYLVIMAASIGGLAWLVWRAWGVAGLALPERWRQTWPLLIPVLWLAYVVVASMLTHGEARYRHFFLTLLIPFAAVGLVQGAYSLWRWLRRPKPNSDTPSSTSSTSSAPTRWQRLLRRGLVLGSSVLIIAIVHTVLLHYPWDWALRGAGKSWYVWQGNQAMRRDDPQQASDLYQTALSYRRTADAFLARGNAALALGDLETARVNYRKAWQTERLYLPASTRLGDVYRRLGQPEAAREAFAGSHVAEREVLAWSWQHLDPPPVSRVAVGAGLDYGYVGGMYAAEEIQGTQARWTDGTGLLRLAPPDQRPALLRLRLAAPRPAASDSSTVPVSLCVQAACPATRQTVQVGPTWRTFAVLLPLPELSERSAAAPLVIELHSPAFAAPDGRTLGVLVDWAGVSGEG